MENTFRDFLKSQSLFEGFTDEDLEKISHLLSREEIDIFETVIEEGEKTTDIYLIAEGEVKVLKWDEAKHFQLPVGTLTVGDMFGEMSFLEGSPRSSNIETNKKTVVWKLSRKDFDQVLPEMQDQFNKIIANIAKINIKRLQKSNKAQVKTLRSSLRVFQVRIDGAFLVLCLAILFGILNIFHFLFRENIPISNDLVIWAYWLVLSALMGWVIKKLRYYFDDFGVSLLSIKKTAIETPFFMVIGFLLILLGHYFWPGVLKSAVFHVTFPFLGAYVLYCAAYEWLARGVVQTSFKNIFNDEKGYKTVIMTSFFMTFLPFFSYYPLSLPILSVAFAANILLSAVYFHQKNVFGVFALHIAMGLFLNYL